MKFVVGTGRCGTTRYAEVHDGDHEPHPDLLVSLGCLYAAGVVSDRLAMELLRSRSWSELTVSYQLTPLIEPLRAAFPAAEIVHLVRDRDDTVASMVRMDWYADGEWDYFPVQFIGHVGLGPALVGHQWANPPAYRITAPLVGEMPLREWMTIGQEARCRWWVDWTHWRLSGVPVVIPPPRLH